MYISVTKSKNYIHDVGYDKKGKKYKRRVQFKPKCYIESNNPNCNIKTIYGKSTEEIQFDNIKQYQGYVNQNKSIAQGTIDPCIQYINQIYKKQDILLKLHTGIIDIEVISNGEFPNPNETKYEINCCSIHSLKTGTFYQLSLKDYDKTKNKIDVNPEKIKFKKCVNEVELLRSIIKIIQYEFYDCLIGWNSSQFDFPYIINRCIKVLGHEEASNLSPFNNISCRQIKKKNKTTHSYEEYFISNIDGIILLDYMELYKKYIFEPRESYALDFICSEELSEGKVDYSEFDNLNQLWQNDSQKFTDYNIVDTKLIKELDDKLGLIDLLSSITYKAGCNFTDTLGTIKPWECFLYKEMLNKNICLPIRKTFEKEQYPGAFVKEPKQKIYKWLMSFDFNSLYPHCIRQYNISPETFKEDLSIDVNQDEIDICFFDENFKNPNSNYILTGSGNYFKKDKEGIIPNIIKKLYDERKIAKRQKNKYEKLYNETKNESLLSLISKANNEQMAIKILLNSLYGAMANKNFIFYDIRFARSITLSAQLQTKFIEKYIIEHKDLKKYLIKSVYCDTDSWYGSFEHLINVLEKNNKVQTDDDKVNFLEKFSNDKLQPIINEGCNKLAEKMSCENLMIMEREVIAKSGFWLGKKKYALSVLDKEGIRYRESKLKVTGIEIVRSSTPAKVKPFLRSVVKKILENENISKYIKECKKQYDKFDIEFYAFPRSANNFDKYYINNEFQKGIPIAVRSAIIFNKYIDKMNLESKYAKIKNGDKIKFLYLKQPNVLNSDVVGFLRKLPKELHKYVDRETMWYKSFYSVIEGICDKIGIEYEEPKVNVNDLF